MLLPVSQKEIDLHEDTGHAVYRPWCLAYVAGRGRTIYHKPGDKEAEDVLPSASLDYGFMGQDDNDEIPILFAKDRRYKLQWSFMVQAKGVNDYAVKALKESLSFLAWMILPFDP